ncbi:hypothetical protein [Dinoroseobacter sp. S124A]|uniref:hypothetical protein n=1 Tax=Dinoroseobacter sp. S124A TaxID=3415128 RepID=UPI003C7E15B2
MTTGTVIFDPYLPWVALAVLTVLMAGLLLFAGSRGLLGAWIRGLAAAALLVALANPSLQEEDRSPLTDIVLVVVDDTASQRISDRAEQTEAALAELSAEIEARSNTELRVVRVGDGPGNAGTLLTGALTEALTEIPQARLAGTILLSDGQVHDLGPMPTLPAPLHLLLTGREGDWDRRLVVKTAPAFGILGEEVELTLSIEDQGDVPQAARGQVSLQIAIDGGEGFAVDVPVGRDITVPLMLEHGGMNVVQLSVPEAEGELTDRNNAAVVQINGVRDRLRVLLVSGEPHAGERTWRNLLKSDSAVDLVHFTILRPPEKQDGVPVSELSLIAFPTRELFLEKIDDFDLIIFDRYRRRGILPQIYLANIAQYVESGGAVLVAAGPDFASANSIYRSPLADILPGEPTAQVIEEGFTPAISDVGDRHPVTAGLAPADLAEGETPWGRWFRLIEVEPMAGDVVMTGPGDRPLLLLDRVGEGRVALLASDHAWLWSRGYEGGGPQLELLRRLAHWMMKEPELEEDALTATAEGQTMTITRRALTDGEREVTIVGPDGVETVVPLTEIAPGRWSAEFTGAEPGLYRLAEGDLEAVVALGPAAPREFEETLASGDKLALAVNATRGGVLTLEDGVPRLRDVGEGRNAAGRGWIGLTPREAALTTDLRISPLIAAWLFLALVALLTIAAWLREGRRSTPG